MSEGLSAAEASALITSLIGTYKYVQLHTGAPGAAGTANVAGNSTRKLVAFGAVSGGAVASNADITWTAVPTTEQYLKCSFWDALTAGNFGVSGAITGNAVTAGDTATAAAGTITISLPVAS